MAAKKEIKKEYDVIVVGGGPMGLATAMECAKAGKKVVLYERFVFFNQSGSSNDYARMYRTMYTEDYMAQFMHICMKFWEEFGHEAGEGNLLLKTGLLNFGDPSYGAGGPEGTLEGPIPNLKKFDMPFKELTAAQIEEQYPFKDLPSTYKGVFAPDNGVINLPLLLRTLYRMCAVYGVELVQRAQVDLLVPDANGATVAITLREENSQVTSRLSVHGKKIAITSGAYTNQILKPSFGTSLDLDIWEMEYAYYSVNPGPKGTVFNSMWFHFASDDKIPGTDKDDWRASNLFYGFPALPWGPDNLCRIAVDNAVTRIKDPADRGLAPSSYDLGRVEKFLKAYVPGAVLQPAMSGICLQTNLPDNLYALGYYPGNKNIAIFTAGWAMKAVPMIGWIMKELLIGDLKKADPVLAEIVFTHFALDREVDGKPILIPDERSSSRLSRERPHILHSGSAEPRGQKNEGIVQKIGKAAAAGARKLLGAAPAKEVEVATVFSRGQFGRRLLQNHRVLHPTIVKSTNLLKGAKAPKKTAAADLTVGIVGAGMAGLYASMILQDLGIKTRILEANPDRLGGRVYTYRFNPEEWAKAKPSDPAYYNYIDVGAMRIPELGIMDRLSGTQSWSLLNKLNNYLGPIGQEMITLIPYTYGMDNNVKMYNGIRMTNKQYNDTVLTDPFAFSDSKNGGPGTAVPDIYSVGHAYDEWLDKAISPFTTLMAGNFDNGFDHLMQVDALSTRSYLYGLDPGAANKTGADPILMKTPLPVSVVNWCETLDTATGLYDEAFSETVMDAYDFSGSGNWSCVRGGMDRFVAGLVTYLTDKAGGIVPGASESSEADSSAKQSTKKQKTAAGSVTTGTTASGSTIGPTIAQAYEVKIITPSATIVDQLEVRGVANANTAGKADFAESFSHVINTAPLSIQRHMDMSNCGLTYKQNEAIRTLHYDFSDKVCLKFKSRFWEQDGTVNGHKYPSGAILGGQSSTDSPLRTVVYPSYGTGMAGAPGVMIASYSWAQDASRMGALTGSTGGSRDTEPDVRTARRLEAIQLCLEYLAQIHGDIVWQEYIGEYFVMDWYNEPFAQGAFALFGPAQFTDMFPSIVQPAAGGRLHFAGEATSVHHAWIVGALNSAYRTVWEILEFEGLTDLQAKMVKNWGVVDEVDYGKYNIPQVEPAKEVKADARRLLGSSSSSSSAGANNAAHVHFHKRM